MKRSASAVWEGDLKGGNGTVSTESGVLTDTNYSFAKRFGDEKGSNPEELLAAAHAACYSMALSNVLAEQGLTPDRVATTATATLEMLDEGPTVTGVHLEVKAKVPGASQEDFEKAANGAKTGCVISRALSTEITMEATLES